MITDSGLLQEMLQMVCCLSGNIFLIRVTTGLENLYNVTSVPAKSPDSIGVEENCLLVTWDHVSVQ